MSAAEGSYVREESSLQKSEISDNVKQFVARAFVWKAQGIFDGAIFSEDEQVLVGCPFGERYLPYWARQPDFLLD